MNDGRMYDCAVPKSLCNSCSVSNIPIYNYVNDNSRNFVTSATFYHFPQQILDANLFICNSNERFTIQDALLLENRATKQSTAKIDIPNKTMGLLIHKSKSYNGGIMIKPKSTIIKQDDYNGHHVIMIPKTSCSTPSFCTQEFNVTEHSTNNEAIEEHDTFLNEINDTAASNTAAAITTAAMNRRYTRPNKKAKRYAICYRIQAIITQYNNVYLHYLLPLFILMFLIFMAYLTRNYAKRLLYWIEVQNAWIIFILFIIFFIIVSFPIVVGYFVLMITAGYLFGFIKGLLTVILGANIGIIIAHLTLRRLRNHLPIQKIIKNETGRGILRVISGPRAFRVVLFTRLTPIPFGLQNTIFGISSINSRLYHIATFLGLLPAQMINVYLGSTLRSMHEVLNNQDTALTGYISFAIEVICGIALMCWVVQKARQELSNTLLTDLNNDNKLIDIQV